MSARETRRPCWRVQGAGDIGTKARPGGWRLRNEKRALVQADAMYADHVLHPDIGYWANITAAYRSKLIRAGYQATLAHQERLLALHQRRA